MTLYGKPQTSAQQVADVLCQLSEIIRTIYEGAGIKDTSAEQQFLNAYATIFDSLKIDLAKMDAAVLDKLKGSMLSKYYRTFVFDHSEKSVEAVLVSHPDVLKIFEKHLPSLKQVANEWEKVKPADEDVMTEENTIVRGRGRSNSIC